MFSNDYTFFARPGPPLGRPCLTAEPVQSVAANAPSRSTPRSCSTPAAGRTMFNYRARHSEAEALRLLLLLPTPPLLQPPIAAAAIAAATEEAEAAGEGLLLLLRGNLVVAEQTVLPRARYPPPRTVTHVRRSGPFVHACLECTPPPPPPLTRPSAGGVRCPPGPGASLFFPPLEPAAVPGPASKTTCVPRD